MTTRVAEVSIRTCMHCGKIFHLVNNTRGRFCSRGCYKEYRKTNASIYHKAQRITLTCDTCGKSFERLASQVGRGKSTHNYCCQSCAGKAGSISRGLRKPSVTVVCQHCGKEFLAAASRAERRKYCSRECFNRNKRQTMAYEGNPNYRHGRNQSSARYVARAHYAQACIVCGFDVVVQVHHIVPKAQGGQNDPANLAVLCPNHHAMVEQSLLSQGELFAYARAARITLQE